MKKKSSSSTPEWFRARRYLHFDLPISAKSAQQLASNPAEVARHAFYPLVHTIVKTTKIERDQQTRRISRTIKVRNIAYSSHADSHIYAYYSQVLVQLYELQLAAHGLTKNILAFRSLGKSNVTFAQEAFQEILKRENCDVLAFDIEGFFDNLDHKLLMAAWRNILGVSTLPADHYNVYRAITRWARVEKIALYKNLGISLHNPKSGGRKRLCDPPSFRKIVRPLIQRNAKAKGIPQGTPISATLSNIYLLEFDQQLQELALQHDAVYFRYCDDIMIIAPPNTRAVLKVAISEQVSKAKLALQPDKTEERTFKTDGVRMRTASPLQYLGFTFDGKHTRVRSSSIARYCERMRKGISTAKKSALKHNKAREADQREGKPLYLKKLNRRYSTLGRRNFISYAYKAASTMNSRAIKRQIKPLLRKFRNLLTQ